MQSKEKNLIKNFNSLTLSNVGSDKEINNTFDFLCINKETIEKESNDYQTSLFYLFYGQTYNCFDKLSIEYAGQKQKLDILETWLNNTLNRIIVLYEQKRIQDILIFTKNQIDLTINSKASTTKRTSLDGLDFIPDNKNTILDRIELEFQIKYIIDKIGLDTYKDLIQYYNNEDVKTNSEMSKHSQTLKAIKTII